MNLKQVQIEQIFSTALTETNPATRQAYIEQACGEDEELLSRVRELLHAHHKSDSFLEPLVTEPESADTITRNTNITEVPGKRIGHYKLIERIGEGGFGTVFLAEQSEPVRRQVALKIIKLGMDTKQVIARFEAERQALAMMEHSSIAKVLDAGATETGRPYFVMELVRGIPITTYCDNNRLNGRQRMELFLQLCDAVQHAHQKGIIHRDLKPSNVLVTLHDTVAVPKIIDFGIAKATSQRLTDKTYYTGFREFIGTPEYMSPEQASISALDVDTRTDIYSLGVLLYELLTGTTPFDTRALRDASYEEIERIIREIDPHKPSSRVRLLAQELPTVAAHRRTEPDALFKLLRGDLDWIVMKAIDKDRTRRYQAVSDLAGDIRRHLNHEPVLASPPSMGYKLSKFVRRNRVAVLAATVVGVAMIIGSALATAGFVQATRATRALQEQRDQADAARASAEASAAEAQREAVESAAVSQFLQSMLAAVDPSRALGREVSVRYVLDEAAGQLDTGAFAEQPEVEAVVRVTLGKTYEALGLYADAESHLRRATEIRSRVLGDGHPETLQAASALAGALNNLQNFAQSESLASQTLDRQQHILGPEHPDTLITMNRLGAALSNQDKLDEAASLHQRALQIQRRVLGEEDISTLRSAVFLGNVLQAQGKFEQAETLLRDALIVERRVLGDEHPETMSAMSSLARVLARQKKYAEAETLYHQSWQLNRRILGPDHPRTSITMNDLLHVLTLQGKDDEKRPLVAERLARLKRAAARPDADALALNAYAWELVTSEPEDLRDPEAALPIAQHAVELDGGNDAGILDTLARVYRMNGDLDSAIATQRQAVARARVGGLYSVSEFEDRLSDLLLERGDLLGAVGVSWEGLATQFGRSLRADAILGGSLALRGQSLIEEGDYAQAEQLLRACLATRQKDLPPGHWLISETMSLLGEAIARQDRFDEAELLLLEGYEGIKSSPQVSGDRKLAALERLIHLYDSWDRPQAAQHWREKRAPQS